jgi:hypothetical protein
MNPLVAGRVINYLEYCDSRGIRILRFKCSTEQIRMLARMFDTRYPNPGECVYLFGIPVVEVPR